jgi:hypothetical protein
MRLFRLSLILALTLPAALAAQRSRDPSRGNVRGTPRREPPPQLRTKDLENLNPARIAIERQKDLALTADETARLDSAAKAYDLEAKDFGKGIDTLQSIMGNAVRNLMGNPRGLAPHVSRDPPKSPKDSIGRARNDSTDQAKADRDQERYMAAHDALSSTLLRIRAAYDDKLNTVNALLSEDQRGKIAPWFASASDELTARLHAANAGIGNGR